ncbi:hypothetical protein ACFXJ8_41360 [Nonomuraea sp. NPDC059194]|uniref:hypothetical protein n=1 Tax=Nonomuraea sp. NPDC059194 TaxID=3346764 RepID=UPI0036AA9C68
MANPPPGDGMRSLLIARACVIVVSAVLWAADYVAWMAVSVLEMTACGLDPMTEYETQECAPLSTWSTVTFFTWILTPMACAMFFGLISLIPWRRMGARLAALWLIPVLPLSIGVGAVLAYVLYWPLSV